MKDREGAHLDDDLDAPLGAEVDLEEWHAQAPPAGFAETVLGRVRAEAKPARRARRWLAAGGVVALAVAASVVVWRAAPPAHGAAIAQDRVEIAIGARARAVLERGADVRWDGDEVVQTAGDVFYRVEPGARFRVHTPAGDVEVKGTCFTVKVRPHAPAGADEADGAEAMNDATKTKMRSAAAGAALTALAFVLVHEGKVAVSHGASREDLAAGEAARVGPSGVARTTSAEGDALAEASSVPGGDFGKANENLVRQIGEYRARLEAISSQKAALETKLRATEERLAKENGEPPKKHEFDLDANDWKELAKDGTVKFAMPCTASDVLKSWPNPKALDKLGLAPDDGPTLKAAAERLGARVSAEIRPVCAQVLGSAEIAAKLEPPACVNLVMELERARDKEAAAAAQKLVAEIRAGIKPMPRPGEALHPVTRVLLTMTSGTKWYEEDLAQSFGPAEAHRIVFGESGCANHSVYGGSGRDVATE